MVSHRVEKEVSRGKRLWFLEFFLQLSGAGSCMCWCACVYVCLYMFEQVHLCSCVEGVSTHRVWAWKSLDCVWVGSVHSSLRGRQCVPKKCVHMCTCLLAGFLFFFFFRQTLTIQPWLPWDSMLTKTVSNVAIYMLLLP